MLIRYLVSSKFMYTSYLLEPENSDVFSWQSTHLPSLAAWQAPFSHLQSGGALSRPGLPDNKSNQVFAAMGKMDSRDPMGWIDVLTNQGDVFFFCREIFYEICFF